MAAVGKSKNLSRLMHLAGVVAVFAAAGGITIVLVKPTVLPRVWRETPFAALVGAAPPNRSVIGRLTGFPYQRFESPLRPDHKTANASATLRLVGVAAEVNAAPALSSTPEQLHALGVASLVAERWKAAVATLESAVEHQTGESDTTQAIEKSTNAGLLNDLSVAYLAAATHAREPSLVVAAIECAESAWNRSRVPEAAWNRAVAFEAIHLNDRSRLAWADYLKLDPGSSWSAEASEHLSDLARQEAAPRPEAATACASIGAAVRQAERELFPRWGRAVIQNDVPAAARTLEAIRSVGEAATRCNGDRSIAGAVAVIAALRPGQNVPLAGAYRDFGSSANLYATEDYHGAGKRLREVEPIFTTFADPFRWRVNSLAASCAYYENDFASADALASLVINGPAGEIGRPLLGRAYWIRGSSRGARGLVYEAIADYQAAANVFATIHDAEGTLGVATLLASQFETAGEQAEAWMHRISALELASRGTPTVQTELLLLQMARVAMRDGQRTAARSFLDEQLSQTRNRPEWPDLRVRALLMRAEVELQSKNPEAARRDRGEAFALASMIRSEDVRFFTTTSADFVRARVAEGIVDEDAAIETAAQYARAHGHKIRLAELLVLAGESYQRRGDPKGARRVTEEAVRAIESQGKSIDTVRGRDAFFESRAWVYSAAISVALDQHDSGWGFRLAELNQSGTPVSLAAAQAALPSGTGIVRFCILPDRLLIWFVRHDQTSFIEQPVTSAQLTSKVRQFVTRLRAADDLPDDDELHATLVAPWLNGTAGMDTVVFVTDGELANVPFCALHGQSRTLLESFRITYAPNVTKFLATSPAHLQTAKMTVFAPGSGATGLSDLPQATAEAVRVAKLYRDTTLLLSRDATRKRFISSLPDSTIIHFAGHAIPNERDPRLSALLLSDDGGGEAYVYAHEIASLTLSRTRLVVLAACSTASVPRRRKSGLASLAYAFNAAGAGSVVGTLWPISDESGARFSVDLHNRIRTGMAPATALREIQLMSVHHLPPRDWAAFVAVEHVGGL
jgi:CHAT domain-containing protein/tetratricopeptide (TPR) repeat protein